MRIKKFIIRDVRCFNGKHTLDIKPLTILVGENSTGKTSVLGCLQVVIDSIQDDQRGRDTINFNSRPYQMGAFADIARKTQVPTKEFVLGIELENESETAKYTLYFHERMDGSEPIVNQAIWDFNDGQIIIENAKKKTSDESVTEIVTIRTDAKKNHFRFIYNELYPISIGNLIIDPLHIFLFGGGREGRQKSVVFEQYTKYIESKKMFRHEQFRAMRSISVSPIRAKPQRTYNPEPDTATHDGSEIPMVLNNISSSDKEQWERLRQFLIAFGKESGLFSDISVRRLGKSKNDPFQLQIKAHGRKTNITDVGYGVSQVLPILMYVFNDKNDMYLLQQPELHLHPKGQAALVSLLVEKTAQNKTFVVETHSDYMIDRVRIEIMRGNISPDDVAVIYMHPEGNKVTPHNITFDAQGNMIGVPEGYREFFLKESDALFGFDD